MEHDPSQYDCSKRWEALRKETIEKIKKIDQDTPAQPFTEPQWWLDMMQIKGDLIDLQNKNN